MGNENTGTKTPILSIVLPVYNADIYIRKCIDSILKQTFINYELIIVDDGATDFSGTICDEYAQSDARIKVYHKMNGGLSSARNYGIERATGEYISFVDSDDWIDPRMYEVMVKSALEDNADIVACGHVVVLDGEEKQVSYIDEKNIYTGCEATKMILCDQVLFSFAWDKIYRLNLWNDIRYPLGAIYEDTATTYKVFAKSNRIVQLPECFYFYRRNNEGICLSLGLDKNIKRTNDNFRAFYERYLYVKLHDKYRDITNKCALKAIEMGVSSLSLCILYGNYDMQMVKKELLSIDTDGLPFSIKLRLAAIKYCFFVYSILMKIKLRNKK